MRTSTEHPESPYLTHELLPTGSDVEWKPGVARLLRESPFVRLVGREQLFDADHAQQEDEQLGFDDHVASASEFEDESAALEWEEPGCAGEHASSDDEAETEWFDSEVWTRTAEQVAFRDRVLAAHLARSRAARGAPKRDWPADALKKVPGTHISTLPDTAAAAGRLLAAANAELATAQQAGDEDALRTLRFSATSGYRGSNHQRELWLQYFSAKGGYYDQTQAARERLADGPHSEQAIEYLLKNKKAGGFGLGGRIAAPGYSNHQGGIAIDFWQERRKGHYIANDSREKPRERWRSTWFHGWLKANAATHGFKPIATEEWHWEYRRGATTIAPERGPAGPGSVSAPAGEQVRFAQRVLNATEGERLADDGDLGRLTRAALERFRAKYGLGAAGVLDAKTELALAQRALEELAQASMFAQVGVRDAKTDQTLVAFKSARGLGLDAALNAATRRALTDALLRRKLPSRDAGDASASDHLGGKLWTFTATTLPLRVAVFCPKAALSRSDVEVLVFAHGLLGGCPRPKHIPAGFITDAPFRLGRIVDASGRPMVLVVPLLDWTNPGGERAFGTGRERWHALAKPAHLNAVIAEVLVELGRVRAGVAPSLRNLVIAGHSRAYDFLEPLAHSRSDPQMRQGALARLSAVWSLDATYAGSVANWKSWLDANPDLRVSVIYRPGSKTGAVGKKFYSQRGGRLAVSHAHEDHCAVPAERLRELLNSSSLGVSGEAERLWPQDEWREGYSDTDELEPGQDEYAPRTYDDEAPTLVAQDSEEELEPEEFELEGFESFDGHSEASYAEADEQEDERGLDEPELNESDLESELEVRGAIDEAADDESEFEFEDENYAERALEEEASDKSPLPVPADNPVPFAPLPPADSYWPVRASRNDARLVSYMYQAPSGIIGRAGRMFLAGRKGIRDGKQALRWHVGVDLFANIKDLVVACEDGTIVDFSFFYKAKSGQRTYKLLIEHERSGVVVNYGEITGDSLRKNGLKIGMRVKAGQPVGWVSDTSMLHFETYLKSTTSSHRWWKAEKHPPRELLNPTRYLLHLAQHGLPSARSPSAQGGGARTGSPSAGVPAGSSGAFDNASSHLPQLGAGQTPPTNPGAYRKFRLTTYHVVDQHDVPIGAVRIPIHDDQGRKIAEGSPAFFGQLSLEGTGRLTDGRLINVTGKTVSVSHDDYAEVLAYHRQAYAAADRKRREKRKSPTPTQYSGIVVENGRVVRAFAFHEVAASKRGVGYGTSRGVAYTPFRTLAADIGHTKYAKVDPTWRGKGGLVPPGTHVYIKEYDGLRWHDGTTHDGWFIVNDTGGAIFGAHFDVFTGTRALRKQLKLPAFGQVWFAGIEQRIPPGYAYGLSK